MSRSLLCKLLQKRTYDLLSQRSCLVLFLLATLGLLIAAFRFGEMVLLWSTEKCGSMFGFYSNNVMGKSYEKNLCQHLPIDIVYTWVNGSDPILLHDLSQLKKEMEIELNISRDFQCPFSHCISSHMIIIRPALPTSIHLQDLIGVNFVFADARKIFNGSTVKGKGPLSSIVVFDTTEAAVTCVKWKSITIKGQDYSVEAAFVTSEWTAPNSIMLEDTIIMTLVPSQISLGAQLLQKLPAAMRSQIVNVYLHQDKGIALLTVPDKAALESVLQWEGNLTIDNKEPGLNAANLVLYFTEDAINDDISASRFQDNEELRYSLRSVEKYAPWVQHIYIVTNGQIPYWLNLENSRVSIITHEDLYPNKSHLPTFSSPSIEAHLHRIPHLSQKFIYMNDDVVFGKEIWPEDFYTHSKGHKVYLSWSVPECREGCPSSWINDGYCDKPCNNSDCQWDGGDCKNGSAGMIFNVNMNQHFQSWKDEAERMYCMPNCANSWLADRYCDQACNSEACGFDAGDCGVDNFDKLFQIELDINKHHYVIPQGIAMAYFNLTSFLGDEGTALDGSYEENVAIRTIALNQKYKILTIVLHGNQSATTLSLMLKGIRGATEYQFLFNVSVCTSGGFQASMLREAANISLKITNEPTTSHGIEPITQSIIHFEEFHEYLRHPHILKRNGSIQLTQEVLHINTSILPLNILNTLKELQLHYENGELTEKGHQNKRWNIINNYMESLNANNSSGGLFPKSTKEQNINGTISKPLPSSETAHKVQSIHFSNGNSSLELTTLKLRNILNVELSSEKLQDSSSKVYTGNFPWEKQGIFDDISEEFAKRQQYNTKRKLLDTFGDSLRHVNRLFNQEYGYEPRKVPAHMPHMVDADIINKLQDRFPKEFDITSSHKIRSTTDMQFAFSFFYFIMSEKATFDIRARFDEFDTDSSSTWSDREIRTILAKIHDLPITYDAVLQFENAITNCSQHLPPSFYQDPVPTPPPFERYLNSSLPLVTKALIEHCPPIISLLQEKFQSQKKYKYEIVGEEEVAFKMIHTNMSQVIAQLDDIRKKPRKFICLNDNLEHHKPEAVMVKAVLIDFYESFFPIPSQFELPKEYRNRFLHMHELRQWQQYRTKTKLISYTVLVTIVLITFTILFRKQISGTWRRLGLRRLFLPLARRARNLENV